MCSICRKRGRWNSTRTPDKHRPVCNYPTGPSRISECRRGGLNRPVRSSASAERGAMSLFSSLPERETSRAASTPLAERMRPRSLDEVVGQEHLLAPGKPLRLQIERDDPGSIIFWGPPGVGKTTLAQIIARVTKADFIQFSAVLSGIKEIKQVMADAAKARDFGTRTIVFVDEIHRFNKAQQDAFLPHVEKGNIRLIGATTENPSFEIISALLSRTRGSGTQ